MFNSPYFCASIIEFIINLLGDAKQVKNIMYAIWDAYEVARNV
ncbi:hypothetical protein RBU49_17885 [Clostridium sp. MB40-C1]|nr:hypothetical protein [Clostridium sp. MB40-C1]WMJ80648.1 hypothetical protein RBU49_17885 [Clostridium sp. MB40-C1]